MQFFQVPRNAIIIMGVVRDTGNWHVLCSDFEPGETSRTPMRTIRVIQHIECETPGTIADILNEKGISIQTVDAYKGEPLPKEMGSAAGLVIMGGPMGVYEQERFPFLKQELALIGDALKREIPVLGVCLGSQLLASALGVEVVPGAEKEIGWFPVTLTDSAKTD